MEKDLEFTLGHVGINCADEKEASAVAELFHLAFGFVNKSGSSSIFSSPGVEIMKSPYLGKNGHIAIRTNSISDAIAFVESKGFETDPDTKKFDAEGKLIAIYLKKEFGGFAVHLVE